MEGNIDNFLNVLDSNEPIYEISVTFKDIKLVRWDYRKTTVWSALRGITQLPTAVHVPSFETVKLFVNLTDEEVEFFKNHRDVISKLVSQGRPVSHVSFRRVPPIADLFAKEKTENEPD